MTGFEKRAERKKSDIIRATLNLLLHQSIKGITIHKIANEAGVSPMSIYNYFENKDRLILLLFNQLLDKAIKYQKEIADSNLSFNEKAEKLLFIKTKTDMVNFWKLTSNIESEYPVIREKMEEYYSSSIYPNIIKIIEQGKREKLIDSDLNDQALLDYIEMFRDFYLKRSSMAPNNFSNSDYLESLFKLFWNGIIK